MDFDIRAIDFGVWSFSALAVLILSLGVAGGGSGGDGNYMYGKIRWITMWPLP